MVQTRTRDRLLVIAVALVATYGVVHDNAGAASRGTSVVLSILAIVPLALGRRWPAAAASAATLLTVAIIRDQNTALGVASFCVTLFLIAHLVASRSLTFAAPLALPFFVFTVQRMNGPHNQLASSVPLLLSAGALVVGESMRRRGQAVAALDASEEAMAESMRTQTVMEERARIARELHDIVAHHLSVIAIESEAARLTSPDIAAETGGRLEAIAATAREALTETRRLLGVLREDTGGEPDRAPQPGLGDLDELVERARATGTPIQLRRDGEVVPLPGSVDVAAYRIVQEALTNARRHAPGSEVDVEMSYRDDALHLRIRDYGPGVVNGTPASGHGLTGMRERATLAGGTFASGPAVGGGFEILVTLPTSEPAE